MFNKKNDPLVESVKKVMEQNELLRKIEQSLLEEYGVQSRNALPHELHAEYDAILEEAKTWTLDEDKNREETLRKRIKKAKAEIKLSKEIHSKNPIYSAMATRKLGNVSEVPRQSRWENVKNKSEAELANRKKQLALKLKESNLDPVGKEDADIDNDGDMDKTDKYLHNRRKAIGAAIASKKIDEASYEKDIDETKPVVVHGVKGMKSTAFKKKFKNMDHFSKWSDSEEADDHTVHSVENLKEDSEQLDEKAVSKAQHRFFGLVRAIQKGEAKGSSKAEKAAKEMTTKQVRDYAKTKEKGLPEKIDEDRKRTMKVADAFMSGKKAKEKTLATDGKQITYHGNVIAKHADDEVHVSTAGYGTSPSTRGHVNGILKRLNAPTLSQRKGKVYHGDNEYDGESWIKVKKPSASKIDEESVFEEIRANLEEQLAYAYENYDESSFAEYVESLTEEEIDILGLDEQYSTPRGGPVSSSRTAKDVLRAVDRGPRAPSNSHMGTGAQIRNVPGTSGSGMPGSGFQATAAKPATAPAPAPAAKPATAPAQAPVAKPAQRPVARPAQRPVARPINRPAQPNRPKMSYGARSAGDVGSSLSGTVAGRMSEQTETPVQVKESFESFLRNKFLKD